MLKDHSLFRFLSTLGCLVLAIGCGQSGDSPQRRIVAGTVNFDKAPIDYGVIRFIPEPTGPVAAAMIEKGKFKCDGKGGVPVGTVRVEIEAMPNTGSMSEDEILAKGPPKMVTIPDKYNQSSELKETIPSGSDAFSLNFDLEK